MALPLSHNESACCSIGRAGISPQEEAAIRVALASGKGVLRMARELGTGSSTVQRVKAAMSPPA